MTSLADLRASQAAKPTVSRPEATYDVCLDGALIARMAGLRQTIAEFMTHLESGAKPTQADKHTAQRAGAEVEELGPQIAAESGTLTIRATPTDAEWRRWVDANPARSEGEPGFERDLRVGRGVCNADALLEALQPYVYAWNGDPLGAEDWATTFAAVSPGDRRAIAQIVVGLYEKPRDFSLTWIGSRETPNGSSGPGSPAPSGSPAVDSSAGSPAPSSEG